MKQLFTFFGIAFFVFALNIIVYAEGWRGIVPFHSTRADVEKLLGQPPPPPNDGTIFYTLNKGRSIYFTDEGEVYIVYANDFRKDEDVMECLKKLPEDTVLFVSVDPKNKIKFKNLKLNRSKLKTFDPSIPKNLGYKVYYDKKAGLVITTYKGYVRSISYIAASKDYYLCPSYNEDIESSIQIAIN